MQAQELSGALLDYCVARVEGRPADLIETGCIALDPAHNGAASRYSPSSDWSQGGPIIEREGISLMPDCHLDSKDRVPGVWFAQSWDDARPENDREFCGATPLEAAMRCYVASKFGDGVPDEGEQG